MIYAIDKKQMHDSVITGKVYASRDWTCVISMFLTSFNVYFVCGCACFMRICLKIAIWLFLAFLGQGRLATLLCSWFSKIRFCKPGRRHVQPHTYAGQLAFDETLAQPHFAVVNRSDAVISVFYSSFSTRGQSFAVINSCVAALSYFPPIP